MKEWIQNKVLAVWYRVRRNQATGLQDEYLPSSFSEYDSYRRKYGIAPGDVVTLGGEPHVIKSIEGKPDMNARVEYIKVETGMEYAAGLVDIHRRMS